MAEPHAPAERRPGPALALTLLAMVGVGAHLWWGQNIAGHDGGTISIQKVFWFALAVTLFIWMPLYIWLDKRVAPVLRAIVGVHVILWACRAVAELWLCYGVHRWVPPYGLIHNLTTFLLVTALLYRHRAEIAAHRDAPTRNARRFLTLMRAGIVCECLFAYLFFASVHYDTTHTWFANDEPRFWVINQLTLGAELVLFPLLFLTVKDYYQGTFTQPFRRARAEPVAPPQSLGG